MNTVTVCFTVDEGDVWVDSDGNFWTVVGSNLTNTYLNRTLAVEVNTKDLVRKWRKVDDYA